MSTTNRGYVATQRAWLTPTEAAAMLRTSDSTVLKMLRNEATRLARFPHAVQRGLGEKHLRWLIAPCCVEGHHPAVVDNGTEQRPDHPRLQRIIGGQP